MTLKREIKDAYLEGGNSIYVKTHSNAVYVDENETETLTQRLDNVKNSITGHTSQLNESANEIANIKTYYAEKTEVNDLASNKAEKTDLQTANNNINKNSENIEALSSRMDSFTKLAEGSTTGDAELIDARTGVNGIKYENVGSAIREQVKYLNYYLNDIIVNIGNRINLVDLTRAVANKAIDETPNNNFSLIDQNDYTSLNYLIECNVGEKYCVNRTYTAIIFFDSKKKGMPTSTKVYTEAPNTIFTVPENAKYFSVYRKTQYFNELMVVKGESMPAVYISFNERTNPKLDGKSLYIGGDSIAYGAGSGSISYGDIIASRNNMILTKNAVSGSTISTQANRTDSILEKLQSTTTGSFDYMILEGGINDMFQNRPIGTLSNDFIGGAFNTSTLIGATEKLCETLVTNFPTAKKIFVLVHRKPGYWGEGYQGIKQIDYWNAIKSVLEKWSIKYIDLSQQCALAAYGNSYWEQMFFEPQGTHPTLEAYLKFYVPLIQSELLTL